MPVKISVIVISFNQKQFIQRLVAQLIEQDFDSDDYEIILVECASTDSTREWLAGFRNRNLVPLLLSDPSNRSFARNQGIAKARGEIIVMIDGDHTVSQNFLSVHWSAHQRGDCAIVGKSDFAQHDEFTAISDYLNNGGAVKLGSNQRLPGRYFLTRNCSISKSVVQRVGMFDETFDCWGGEDLDYGVRIEDAGVPIYAEPRALAIHHHFRSIDSLLANLEAYGREGIPILLKNHPGLFRELNLDRVFSNPFDKDRFGGLWRMCHRLLFSRPVFTIVRYTVDSLRSHKLPRFLFDYLHLRQYSRGLSESAYFKEIIKR